MMSSNTLQLSLLLSRMAPLERERVMSGQAVVRPSHLLRRPRSQHQRQESLLLPFLETRPLESPLFRELKAQRPLAGLR